MKKKLFAAATVLLLYSFVIVGLSIADHQGQMPKLLTKLGLTGPSLQDDNDDGYKNPGIDPMPEPPKPPPPDPMQ